MMNVLRRNGVLYPKLTEIVLDGDHIKPSLKDHKRAEAKIIDRARKNSLKKS